MSTPDFGNPAAMAVYRLHDRNQAAQDVIDNYVTAHAGVDVLLGLAGFIPIPGAAAAALVAAIGLQAPVFYQPLARKLAKIYTASPDQLEAAQDDIVGGVVVQTVIADLVADFGIEFMGMIAGEVLAELGFGAAVGIWIPVIGGFIAAGLDLAIATTMTNRVGRMVAIYFQNGGEWVGSKKATYELAKGLTDLSEVQRIDTVRESTLAGIRQMIDMMRLGMTTEQIRVALRSKGIPDDLIDEAL